jgi:hypothetical protein
MPEEKNTPKTDSVSETLKFLEDKVKSEKKKPVHYKQKECPYCKKHVGNLGNHVKMKHPAETPPAEITKEELLGGKTTTPAPKKTSELTPLTYFCTDGKAELRKGENPCWNCGAAMNWEGI